MRERSIVYCDNHLCRITIEPSMHMTGAYFVVVDDDHETSQACWGLKEAYEVAEEVYLDFEEKNSQFGLGG